MNPQDELESILFDARNTLATVTPERADLLLRLFRIVVEEVGQMTG
jgi:hypothetical protein